MPVMIVLTFCEKYHNRPVFLRYVAIICHPLCESLWICVLKCVCCTVLMIICSTVNTLSGLGGLRFYGNGLALFEGHVRQSPRMVDSRFELCQSQVHVCSFVISYCQSQTDIYKNYVTRTDEAKL